jgi:ribosomal protein S18 acetylase RimI-like enzyme
MGQAALAEQYIDGRELNVSLMQRGQELTVLPLAEIDLSALPAGAKIVDYAAKWLSESDAFRQTPRVFPKLPAALRAKVVAAAKAAYRALGCRDYARVDFRLDGRGRPFVLEVNTNPDISPDAGFAAALAEGEVSFDQFVRAVVENAAARAGQAALPAAVQPALAGAQGEYTIRVSAAADRESILDMLARTRFFRPDELEIAREVLDDSLADGPEGDYKSYTIAQGSRPLGWVCWGATPCCLGTYDMYWIVVDPAVQARGLGKMLVAHCERLVRAAGGRLMVIETSGRGEYLSTRRFYLRCGYFEAARVADFYAEGDDKVMYTKYLQDL